MSLKYNRSQILLIVLVSILSSLNTFANDRNAILFLKSKLQENNDFIKGITSSTYQYRPKKSGIDISCFWSIDDSNVENIKNVIQDKYNHITSPVSYEIDINKNWTHLYSQDFSNTAFDVIDPIRAEFSELTRICLYKYAKNKIDVAKMHEEVKRTYTKIDALYSKISLLELIEQNHPQKVKSIERIKDNILNGINELSRNINPDLKMRKMLIQNQANLIDSSSNQQEIRLLELLTAQYLERESFVPKHRYATFLLELYDSHQSIFRHENGKVLRIRSQIRPINDVNSFVLDLRSSTVQELCENYFHYSLPIFLNNIRTQWTKDQHIISTHSRHKVKSALKKFRKLVDNDVSKTCGNNILTHELRRIIDSLINLDLSNKIVKIKTKKLVKFEKSLLLDEKHSDYKEFFRLELGSIDQKSEKVIHPGQIKFFSVSNDLELFYLNNFKIVNIYNDYQCEYRQKMRSALFDPSRDISYLSTCYSVYEKENFKRLSYERQKAFLDEIYKNGSIYVMDTKQTMGQIKIDNMTINFVPKYGSQFFRTANITVNGSSSISYERRYWSLLNGEEIDHRPIGIKEGLNFINLEDF